MTRLTGMTMAEAGFIDDRGRLTPKGKAVLVEKLADLSSLLHGHVDNTGGDCRVYLVGHDCCHACNLAELVLTETASLMVCKGPDGHYPGCTKFGCAHLGCDAPDQKAPQ